MSCETRNAFKSIILARDYANPAPHRVNLSQSFIQSLSPLDIHKQIKIPILLHCDTGWPIKVISKRLQNYLRYKQLTFSVSDLLPGAVFGFYVSFKAE